MKHKPYSWNLDLVMYLLLVADTVTFPGALTFQESWTLAALSITIGGTTSPHAFMNVSIVLVSPWFDATCWNVLIFFAPTALTSFGTFWTPDTRPNLAGGCDLAFLFYLSKQLKPVSNYRWIHTHCMGYRQILCLSNTNSRVAFKKST